MPLPDHLKAFLAVAETGSVTRAAERLGLTAHVGVMLLHQAAMGFLDRLAGGAPGQAQLLIRRCPARIAAGGRPRRCVFGAVFLARTSAGTARAAALVEALALLPQLCHHAAGFIGQPLPGADAIHSKGCPQRQLLLAIQAMQSLLQISPQTRCQAIKPLREAQLRQKAGAIQVGNQAHQPMAFVPGLQLRPPRLLRE